MLNVDGSASNTCVATCLRVSVCVCVCLLEGNLDSNTGTCYRHAHAMCHVMHGDECSLQQLLCSKLISPQHLIGKAAVEIPMTPLKGRPDAEAFRDEN